MDDKNPDDKMKMNGKEMQMNNASAQHGRYGYGWG